MTSTTTGAIDDLLDEKAAILRAALDDRTYAPGLERDLADDLIAAIPADSRRATLEFLLTWEHLMPRVMAVDCLLDETDQRSYDALSAMAAILLAAIDAQDSAPHALRTLITDKMCDRARRLPVDEHPDAMAVTFN
jgi:hypothetical protein